MSKTTEQYKIQKYSKGVISLLLGVDLILLSLKIANNSSFFNILKTLFLGNILLIGICICMYGLLYMADI